jgi:hypothetical protein
MSTEDTTGWSLREPTHQGVEPTTADLAALQLAVCFDGVTRQQNSLTPRTK